MIPQPLPPRLQMEIFRRLLLEGFFHLSRDQPFSTESQSLAAQDLATPHRYCVPPRHREWKLSRLQCHVASRHGR